MMNMRKMKKTEGEMPYELRCVRSGGGLRKNNDTNPRISFPKKGNIHFTLARGAQITHSTASNYIDESEWTQMFELIWSLDSKRFQLFCTHF